MFYGKQVFQFNFDPRSMAEDLGDDVVKANTYGLKNLKYVAANFVDWMAVNDEGYAAVESTYKGDYRSVCPVYGSRDGECRGNVY